MVCAARSSEHKLQSDSRKISRGTENLGPRLRLSSGLVYIVRVESLRSTR
jgi:hypothetical protein